MRVDFVHFLSLKRAGQRRLYCILNHLPMTPHDDYRSSMVNRDCIKKQDDIICKRNINGFVQNQRVFSNELQSRINKIFSPLFYTSRAWPDKTK